MLFQLMDGFELRAAGYFLFFNHRNWLFIFIVFWKWTNDMLLLHFIFTAARQHCIDYESDYYKRRGKHLSPGGTIHNIQML